MGVGAVAVFEIASTTTDVDPDAAGFEPLQGPLFFYGYSLRESAGTPAAATVLFRDGRTDAAKIVAVLELAANESVTIQFPKPIRCSSGLFLDIAGEVEGSVSVG